MRNEGTRATVSGIPADDVLSVVDAVGNNVVCPSERHHACGGCPPKRMGIALLRMTPADHLTGGVDILGLAESVAAVKRAEIDHAAGRRPQKRALPAPSDDLTAVVD